MALGNKNTFCQKIVFMDGATGIVGDTADNAVACPGTVLGYKAKLDRAYTSFRSMDGSAANVKISVYATEPSGSAVKVADQVTLTSTTLSGAHTITAAYADKVWPKATVFTANEQGTASVNALDMSIDLFFRQCEG